MFVCSILHRVLLYSYREKRMTISPHLLLFIGVNAQYLMNSMSFELGLFVNDVFKLYFISLLNGFIFFLPNYFELF